MNKALCPNLLRKAVFIGLYPSHYAWNSLKRFMSRTEVSFYTEQLKNYKKPYVQDVKIICRFPNNSLPFPHLSNLKTCMRCT